MSDSILVYEDNAGQVYLTRGEGEPVWYHGIVTPDREGTFEDDAKGWHEGDWEPGEPNGQSLVDGLKGLEHIATWTPEGGVQIHYNNAFSPVAGAGGQAYLGIDEDWEPGQAVSADAESMTTPTIGYEPEPTDVAAEVDAYLGDIRDPQERYHRATAAQAHHQAVVAAFQVERDKALATLNTPDKNGWRLTYQQISEQVTIGLSVSGVQKAVERGRRTMQSGV